MTPLGIGIILFTFSLLIYTLIGVGYVYPVLIKMPWNRAVVPLLLLQCFRYAPLTLLMPGQVSELFPMEAAQILGYGHFISALFALLAVTMTWHKIKGARFAVWLFSIIGIIDLAVSFITGMTYGLMELPIGFNLYIVNFFMPLIIISHALILILLLKKQKIPI